MTTTHTHEPHAERSDVSRKRPMRTVVFGSGFCVEFEIEFEANEPIGFEDFPTMNFVERNVLDRALADANEGRLELDP